jgi:hypothetical protein
MIKAAKKEGIFLFKEDKIYKEYQYESRWVLVEKVIRDLGGQVQDFPVHRHTADQERTGKEDRKNGHRWWLSYYDHLLDCHSGCRRHHPLSVSIAIHGDLLQTTGRDVSPVLERDLRGRSYRGWFIFC